MGLKNKISSGYLYFVTMTVVDWIDVFTRPAYKHIIIESIEYCQKNKGLKVYSWCLMSNHLHFIIGAETENNLSDIIRDFKKFTSKAIIKEITEISESRKEWMLYRFELAGSIDKKIQNYKFWKEGNEAKEIHTNGFLDQKVNYIHDNPVRAEIVNNAEDYKYSSAIDFAGGKGLINLEIM